MFRICYSEALNTPQYSVSTTNDKLFFHQFIQALKTVVAAAAEKGEGTCTYTNLSIYLFYFKTLICLFLWIHVFFVFHRPPLISLRPTFCTIVYLFPLNYSMCILIQLHGFSIYLFIQLVWVTV